MRVMVIVKANPDSEAGKLPGPELLSEMGQFNEQLVKAGVLLAAEGLQSSARGVRVRFGGGKSTVIDGPFTETKELIAGFWLWQVRSIEEAVEWIRRSPFRKGNEEIEIRRVFEAEDFGENLTPEVRAQEQRLRPSVRDQRETAIDGTSIRRFSLRRREHLGCAATVRMVSSRTMRTETHRTIDAVWRIESARLIAGAHATGARRGLAEELAQDALVTALEQWPRSGIPDNPGAWLMTTARNRAIDQLRRATHARAQARGARRTSLRWTAVERR